VNHQLLDPRGVRFAAALTSLVFVLVLIFSSAWLALVQAVVFAFTAASPQQGPYGVIYRTVVAPNLPPPNELEPAAPVRFAQLVGLVFAVVTAVAYILGLPVFGAVMAGAALAAAFLNAAFGLCLGCEVYLAALRLMKRPVPARIPTGHGKAAA
jgi:glucan phosphoethanolaminetransferase (alkaline phosphatase superfamily)